MAIEKREQPMIVMKFGGASVATPESFHKIAEIIERRKALEEDFIVVVVSAMAHTTDLLLSLGLAVHPNPPKREQDMLVSVGERISISLLAMALSLRGIDAVSFTGSQSGILTNDCHAEAKIVDVRPKRIHDALRTGKVVIVAGFQGMSLAGEITTLGRGGSDTTAVALAAALKAPFVDFYKDVDGIYASDPKIHSGVQKFLSLDYLAAKTLAAKGARVLHLRSIELAEKNDIQLRVRSFHSPEVIGTKVGNAKNRPTVTCFEGEE